MKQLGPMILLLMVCPALADDTVNLYESLDGVRLGRIFMSPDERARLDARRAVRSNSQDFAQQPDETNTEPAVTIPRKPASGYIKSASRKPLVWTNGEFQRAEPSAVERWTFPGTVRIGSSVSADDEVSRLREADPDPESEEP